MDHQTSPALLIKRYSNRKLYNTRLKEYITQEQVAEVVRQGIEIQVVDNSTGEDLTALTLSQILFAQEKRRGGLLPVSLLSALVHAGGDAFEMARRFLSASIDLSYFVNEEIKRRIERLTSQGKITVQDGQVWMEMLQSIEKETPAVSFPFDGLVNHYLEAHGFANHADYERLLNQVENLTAQVDRLTQQSGH